LSVAAAVRFLSVDPELIAMIQTRPVAVRTQQPVVQDHYDVIVIGAGPAGSSTATLLAQAGHDVLLLERSQIPRFHVGESLIPDTYWTLERLGVLDELRHSAFPKKYSVQFVSENGRESAPFYFDEWNPHESSQTWQVERGEFDRLLVDNARKKGVTVRSDAQVTDVMFADGRANGVRVRLLDGDTPTISREIGCRVVVDATGQTAFLAHRLGLKQPDPKLRKGTIWSYWRNAERGEGVRDEGATLILSTRDKNSWFWFIPLPDNITSVGVTGDMEYIFDKSRGTAAEVYQQELERCPGLQKRLTNAERVHDFFTTKDFSYTVTKSAGDGWVMVGDAAGFIDPIYSSGVYLALKSAELVADATHEALVSNDLSGDRLGQWYPRYCEGKQMFHWLVYAFYTKEFSFAEFLRRHPEHKGAVTDILIGNVFREGLQQMFVDMHAQFPATRPSDVWATVSA
jgi:flavin-dependent dehydrogenase